MTKEELLKYLIEHPSYSRESLFKKFYEKEYKEILEIKKFENIPFLQKLYHYLHNDYELSFGICKNCGKRCSFVSIKKGYCNYCSYECSSNNKSTKEKRKKTNLAKYGNVCSLHGKEIEQKTKETKFLKYGDANYNNREQFKKTCFEKYGVNAPLQSKEIMKKLENTNEKKYGVKQVFELEEIKDKRKKNLV